MAIVVVAAFAVGEFGWNPENGPYAVLTLFTWLTNTGAFGLVLLMVLVSITPIGYFRRDRRGVDHREPTGRPAHRRISTGGVAVLILVNFDVLLGQAESNALTFLLPAIVVVPGVLATFSACRLRRTKNPDVYRGIGHGNDDSAAPHLGEDE